MVTTKRVAEVQPGDHISWYGRVVRVLRMEPYRPDGRGSKRQGRYLMCEVALDDIHRLHYWDDEVIVSDQA